MSWPGGLGTDLHLKGRARDLLTPVDGAELHLPFRDAAKGISAALGTVFSYRYDDSGQSQQAAEAVLSAEARASLMRRSWILPMPSTTTAATQRP